VILWSVCRETFCLTAYEAVAGGAAVITNLESGNVVHFVTERECGATLRDERALFDLFASGAVMSYARARRSVQLYDLEYSEMTAYFLEVLV
jgi:hypothetical protein